MALRTTSLPLFPLSLVLFPGMTLPLHIFEERYKRMINLCLREARDFGVVLAGAETGVPGQHRTYPVGSTAHNLSAGGPILAGVATWEREIMIERQKEGIAKAKSEGKFKGRPPSLKPADVQALRAQGIRPADIAKRLGMARSSVYRLLTGSDAA